MKRMMNADWGRPAVTVPRLIKREPTSTTWNGMTIPTIPAADWPASVALDHALDRVVREAFGTGRSLQEAAAHVTALAHVLVPHLTEAEIDERLHAQVLANI